MDMDEQPEDADFITELQEVVAGFDPDAMPLNIICIVEWMEPDGTYSMSTIHTPMPVWHMRGLLSEVDKDISVPLVTVYVGEAECEDED